MKSSNVMWLSATLMIVFLFAIIALAQPTNSPSITTTASPAGAAELYARHCASCHGRDGRAQGFKARAKGTRNLTDREWQERVSDERIFNAINNGKGRMPGFGKKLSEAEVDSLVKYVRGLRR
jgi:mono/diheme cytochrome c family protein